MFEEVLKELNDLEKQNMPTWYALWKSDGSQVLLVSTTSFGRAKGIWNKYYDDILVSHQFDISPGLSYTSGVSGGYASCIKYLKNCHTTNQFYKWADWKLQPDGSVDLKELAKDPKVIITDEHGNKLNEAILYENDNSIWPLVICAGIAALALYRPKSINKRIHQNFVNQEIKQEYNEETNNSRNKISHKRA